MKTQMELSFHCQSELEREEITDDVRDSSVSHFGIIDEDFDYGDCEFKIKFEIRIDEQASWAVRFTKTLSYHKMK